MCVQPRTARDIFLSRESLSKPAAVRNYVTRDFSQPPLPQNASSTRKIPPARRREM